MKLLFIVYQCGKKVNSQHVFYLPFPIFYTKNRSDLIYLSHTEGGDMKCIE